MEKLWHPLFTSEQEVTNYFAKKPHAKQAFEDLGPFWQPRMMQFMLGKKTLPLTYDPFFKKYFMQIPTLTAWKVYLVPS